MAALKSENEKQNIIGGNIRRIRNMRGLSQIELAAMMRAHGWKISSTSVSKIEKGVRGVYDREVFYLSKVLEVSIADLFEGL